MAARVTDADQDVKDNVPSSGDLTRAAGAHAAADGRGTPVTVFSAVWGLVGAAETIAAMKETTEEGQYLPRHYANDGDHQQGSYAEENENESLPPPEKSPKPPQGRKETPIATAGGVSSMIEVADRSANLDLGGEQMPSRMSESRQESPETLIRNGVTSSPALSSTDDLISSIRFPDAFYDGMTGKLMRDPVVTSAGVSLERSTVADILTISNSSERTPPDEAKPPSYYPNRALRSMVEREIEAQARKVLAIMHRRAVAQEKPSQIEPESEEQYLERLQDMMEDIQNRCCIVPQALQLASSPTNSLGTLLCLTASDDNAILSSLEGAANADTPISFPEELHCAITCELVIEPRIDPDGYTFEREAIEEWIDKNGNSPVTRSQLHRHQLRPNNALAKLLLAQKHLLPSDVLERLLQAEYSLESRHQHLCNQLHLPAQIGKYDGGSPPTSGTATSVDESSDDDSSDSNQGMTTLSRYPRGAHLPYRVLTAMLFVSTFTVILAPPKVGVLAMILMFCMCLYITIGVLAQQRRPRNFQQQPSSEQTTTREQTSYMVEV